MFLRGDVVKLLLEIINQFTVKNTEYGTLEFGIVDLDKNMIIVSF